MSPTKKVYKKAKPKETTTKFKATKQTNLAELVYKYPDTAEVIMDYGLHCIGCIASSFDTIEAGAKVHGMSDEELDEMIERINEVINYNE
jgi:hybrid cluster-associated redox disulfide protein